MKLHLYTHRSLVFLLFFLCASCHLEHKVIYEGPTVTTQKLFNAFKEEGIIVGIDTDTTSKKSSISAKVNSLARANKLLSVLKPIIDSTCDTGAQSISRYFIPRKITTDKQSADVSEFSSKLSILIHAIEALPHVIHVSCDYVDDAKDGNINLKVWSSSQSDLDVLAESLKEIERALGYDFNAKYSHVNLKEVLLGTDENTSPNTLTRSIESDGSLILFEPFRFHVLEREKVSAGFQFIIMLTLFLISGFTIGFWWAKRYNDKEK